MVQYELALDLAKIGEPVLFLTDLDSYFWGRTVDPKTNLIDDGVFQEIARLRISKAER
jgi:hypothetical protein